MRFWFIPLELVLFLLVGWAVAQLVFADSGPGGGKNQNQSCIEAKNFEFRPKIATTTGPVCWVVTQGTHTISGDAFESHEKPEGTTFAVVLPPNPVGIDVMFYDYRCRFHPIMTGTIAVATEGGPSPMPEPTSIPTPAPRPDNSGPGSSGGGEDKEPVGLPRTGN